ncbi:MAG: hypothetical protein KGZ66_05320 [Selenomonadales bacterium]|jgi:hypothetical protein|nr:hypothetical protein [Selenomonadales bacterium]
MAVVIIEGVVATGKTLLVKAIEETPFWQERPTKVMLSEHYTERVLELTSPSVLDRQALLTEHLGLARQLHKRYAGSRFRGNRAVEPLVIIERFHLTHAAQVGDFAPFLDIDAALCELGARLILLHHPPESLLKNILATIPERPPMWARWLRSLGNEQEIESYFSRLQDSCLAYYEQSRLLKQQYRAYSLTPAQLADAILGL